jgi:DNA-binding transcriptional MerR regulator
MSSMRSKDIAELAGVTPRALRHYHQIGLLPEPLRDRNGYRRYDIPDLIRLLRIKGLAAAGIALSDMPSFLDGRGAPADDLLEALDKQLLDQISRLEQQRQLVARLRNDANAPGVGLDLIQPFKVLTDGRSESSTEAWRDQLTLFSHLLSPEELAKLFSIYERMARESDKFVALGKKFDALGPDSDEKDIDDLAKIYVDHFEEILLEFKSVFESIGIFRLVYAHAMSNVNSSQQKMISSVASYMK